MNKEKWNRLLAAARKGDAEAQWEVGVYFEDGLKDGKGKTLVRQNPVSAVSWYRRAAENGNIAGQVALGVCLSSGAGSQKDNREAKYWTKKAIQAGEATASSNLATIYRDEEDYRRAFHWFKRSVEMGHDDALCEIGQYYYLGLGVQRSSKRAVECFTKLVKLQYPEVTEASRQTAMYWLGIAHLQGQGVPRSVKKAKELFREANKDGDHMPSQEMLLILGIDYN